MSLRDLLKKKDKIKDTEGPPPPEFKFTRTDTSTQEVIQPPSHQDASSLSPGGGGSGRFSFRRLSQNSSHEASPTRVKGERRLSHRLGITRSSRSASSSSVNLPSTLPSVDDGSGDAQEREAQWEKRATVLAQSQLNLGPSSPLHPPQQRSRSPSVGRVGDVQGDVSFKKILRRLREEVRMMLM